MAEVAATATAVVAVAICAGSLLVLITAAFLHPKVTAGVLVILTMLSQTIQTVTGAPAMGYFDEVGVLLALALFVGHRLYVHGTVRWYPAMWFFVAFAGLGLVSSVFEAVPLAVTATGAFLFLKGPLFGFALAQLDWRVDDIPRVARFGAGVVIFILITALINAAAPSAWNSFIGRVSTVSERGGMSSLTGPFDHPVGLGTTMSMAFLAVLLYRHLVRKTWFNLGLMVATGLACIAAFRRKSIAAATVTAIGMRAVLPGHKAMYYTALVILVPVALILAWEPLTAVVQGTLQEYTANVSETARVRMTIDGFALALTAFPFGVGFGRFASFTASDNYSPLYEDLGYQRIYGMGPGELGGFLSDTFWPAPIAETGLLGALCYAGALYLLCVPAWRMMRRANHSLLRWVGAVTVAWFVTLTVESVVAPVFVSPPMFALPFVAAGMCAALVATSGTEQDGEDESASAGGSDTPLPWAGASQDGTIDVSGQGASGSVGGRVS
ncbi:hypothetical protein GWK18_07340 [Kocuria sp. JC486]|uniref:hypothetical protein n=1 Tax=Kocuria sp. JC486 TaxID=1970736 RepID=UPI001421E375|nr:hypothetical protein [Kocuria sp. JC486]NHU85405.1 hypothetical protein [Kocuria sp. JC486]